jgi:hypothetical protein
MFFLITVFWDRLPSSLAVKYERFGGTLGLHILVRHQVPQGLWNPSVRLHRIISQKVVFLGTFRSHTFSYSVAFA